MAELLVQKNVFSLLEKKYPGNNDTQQNALNSLLDMTASGIIEGRRSDVIL
jgi:hypothetical protein